MKKMIKRIIVLLATVLIVFACEEEMGADVNQDTVYTDYELFYDSDQDITRVLAKFRFGGPNGTILDISDSGEVKFNGDVLPYNPLWTGHIKEYPGRITSGTFRYTNAQGITFVNQTPTFDTANIPMNFDTLNKNNAMSLDWEGPALKANQGVALFIGSSAVAFEDGLFIESGQGATSLTLSKSGLQSIANGSATAVLDRQTEVEVTEGTSKGGLIRTKYRAPTKTIFVKD